MPYRITQCYLPPDRGENPTFTPNKAGTRFSNPGGMQGWVDLCYVKATSRELNPPPVNCSPTPYRLATTQHKQKRWRKQQSEVPVSAKNDAVPMKLGMQCQWNLALLDCYWCWMCCLWMETQAKQLPSTFTTQLVRLWSQNPATALEQRLWITCWHRVQHASRHCSTAQIHHFSARYQSLWSVHN